MILSPALKLTVCMRPPGKWSPPYTADPCAIATPPARQGMPDRSVDRMRDARTLRSGIAGLRAMMRVAVVPDVGVRRRIVRAEPRRTGCDGISVDGLSV